MMGLGRFDPRRCGLLLVGVWLACTPPEEVAPPVPPPARVDTALNRPSILLVTLDTTRADAVEPESDLVPTPTLAALAGRGRRFLRAYSTAPTTLPAHASIFTGLYPSDHGVHENSRPLGTDHELLSERLLDIGYQTAAFVSGFPLRARFGLARGFETYDDDFGSGLAERSARETTDRALDHLRIVGDGPLLLWVHYYDPHFPYLPPEPYRSLYPDSPYHAEIAAMDAELGRLVEAFETRGGGRIVVVGDHGEGLGDHGEELHGNLVYDETMRVPLLVVGDGTPVGEVERAVSLCDVFATILGWAEGSDDPRGLDQVRPVVLGEAMKPHLQYGWRPQVMGVADGIKLIRAGELEVYDLEEDPAERQNLAPSFAVDRSLASAVASYPVPEVGGPTGGSELTEEERRTLASLGYAGSQGRAPLRENAPAPRDMVHLFADLDRSSELFVAERWDEVLPLLEGILSEDPQNLMVLLRLAVARSRAGRVTGADEAFRRAASIAPESSDLRRYHALHLLRSGRWVEARPLLESVVAAEPDRPRVLEALAEVRLREGRPEAARPLLDRAAGFDTVTPGLWLQLGRLHMERGETEGAIDAFERARSTQGGEFPAALDLGVLYLAADRIEEARDSLDRVSPGHPAWALALFKRAQVSVLLREPDADLRIGEAWQRADPAIRELMESERLFAGRLPR